MTRWHLALVAITAMAVTASAQGTGGVRGRVALASGRPAAEVVVSLTAPGLVVHPPAAPLTMDQKGLLFRPHVMAIVRGTTVRFMNNDPEDHNVYSPEGGYNLGTWPPGQVRDQVFDRPGVYTQLCRIHPDMEAFIVVLDTPYFAVTDAQGRYEITGVAPGSYTLATWGKRLKPLSQPITVAAAMVPADLTVSR